jgi:hypothetical protein
MDIPKKRGIIDKKLATEIGRQATERILFPQVFSVKFDLPALSWPRLFS